ncbi:ferredoxin-NADP reductase [Natranaerovirga pectinivora]|uniref:Ferredoxin-NADP reductase n=1 Tax=Natranaerovirga pectinivora TaxID=682400 RepID=A0A4R3MII6_9FIRM|nr:FAD-dependent oxidoreductase [Natranaerovirga pectinivora]TCT12203.1 ferredoxin-NADP reductase [Natranaerovirga pectinivora]
MNLLKDILPIFKKYQITFKEKYREVGDIYTFIFESEEQINWKAGQHGICTINHVKINKPTRAFSIASIPSEGHIKISMRISENPSEYKQALLNLQPGMKISMRGPIGSFYTENQKPLLFIAGGIGITPYRALIKNLLLKSVQMSNDVQLLYMDSREEFIYREELEEAGRLSAINTKYLNKREALNEEIEKFIAKHNNEGEYFIVGTKSMVNPIKALLKSKGIKKKNIKKDTFFGY